MASSGRPLSTLMEIKSLIQKQYDTVAAEKFDALITRLGKPELRDSLWRLISSKNAEKTLTGYIDTIKKQNISTPSGHKDLEAIQIFLQLALDAKDYTLALLIVENYSSLLEWADPDHCTAEDYKTISSGVNTICKYVQDAKVNEAILNMRVEIIRASHEMQNQFHRLATAVDSRSHFVNCQHLLSMKLEEDITLFHRRDMIKQQIPSFVQRLDINPDHKDWLQERNAMVEFLALSYEPESLQQHTLTCLAKELAKKADQFSRNTDDEKRSVASSDILARVKFRQYQNNPDKIFLLNHCLAWLCRSSSVMNSLFYDENLHKKVDEVRENQPYVDHAYQVLLDRKAMSTSLPPSADFCREAAARGCIYALEDVIKSFAPDFKYTEDYQSRLLSLFLVLWLELEVRQFEMTNQPFAEYLMTVARNYIFAHKEKKYPELANWACRVLDSKTGDRPHLDEFRCLSVKYQTTPMSILVAHRFATERKHNGSWALARVQFTTAMQSALDVDLTKFEPVAPTAAVVKSTATAPLKSSESKTQPPATPTRVVSTIFADLKKQNEDDKKRLGKENFQYTFGIFENTNRATLSRRRSSDNSHEQEPTSQRRHGRSQSF